MSLTFAQTAQNAITVTLVGDCHHRHATVITVTPVGDCDNGTSLNTFAVRFFYRGVLLTELPH
jgi:hypothetical protein